MAFTPSASTATKDSNPNLSHIGSDTKVESAQATKPKKGMVNKVGSRKALKSTLRNNLKNKGSYQDKYAVVVISASWCPPCKNYKPTFEMLAKNNPDVLMIEAKIPNNKDSDKDFNEWSEYINVGFPTILILDKQGNIVKTIPYEHKHDPFRYIPGRKRDQWSLPKEARQGARNIDALKPEGIHVVGPDSYATPHRYLPDGKTRMEIIFALDTVTERQGRKFASRKDGRIYARISCQVDRTETQCGITQIQQINPGRTKQLDRAVEDLKKIKGKKLDDATTQRLVKQVYVPTMIAAEAKGEFPITTTGLFRLSEDTGHILIRAILTSAKKALKNKKYVALPNQSLVSGNSDTLTIRWAVGKKGSGKVDYYLVSKLKMTKDGAAVTVRWTNSKGVDLPQGHPLNNSKILEKIAKKSEEFFTSYVQALASAIQAQTEQSY